MSEAEQLEAAIAASLAELNVNEGQASSEQPQQQNSYPSQEQVKTQIPANEETKE